MATKKKVSQSTKLEYSIKVLPKKLVKPSLPKNPPKQKAQKKSPSHWSKIPKQKKLLYIFVGTCSAIIIFSFIAVAISLKRTNDALNHAAKAADSLLTTDSVALHNAKLIGSNEQLSKEIDNYATSPADLQSYALKDYRLLKQKCIVNGQIYGSLSYGIASVADAQYAQIKRNCNGEQTLILKKFGDKWTVVHEGSDPPLCSLVNDLMIPQRVSLNCVIGGTTYLNPNP
jgi:hypothetical protein